MKDLKHIKRFNESEENLNSELSKDSSSISDVSNSLLNVGDKIEIIKVIDGKVMRFLKSLVSVWYDPDIQPKIGDIYLVDENEDFTKDGIMIYNLICLNRKWKDGSNQVGPDIKWIDNLIKTGYIKIL